MPVPTSLKRRLLQELPRREVKATAAVTSTDDPLFTVSNGKVLITELVGEFTIAHSGTANASRIKFNPADSGSDLNLSLTTDLNGLGIGILYSLSGQFGNAPQVGVAVEGMEVGLILPPGDIELECAASPAAGSIRWVLKWIEIDDDGSVAAA